MYHCKKDKMKNTKLYDTSIPHNTSSNFNENIYHWVKDYHVFVTYIQVLNYFPPGLYVWIRWGLQLFNIILQKINLMLTNHREAAILYS